MPKIAPDAQIETITALPLSEEEEAIKQRDESVAALREFFKELFRYLFTLFCFTLVIFLDSNWSQKHSDTPPPIADSSATPHYSTLPTQILLSCLQERFSTQKMPLVM